MMRVPFKLEGWKLLGWTVAAAALLPMIAIQAADSSRKVEFQQKPNKVHVTIAGEVVATYVTADPNLPRPYFAHVRGPGGIQLTRNFPPIEGQDQTDHDTMHPGIWMAFGDLNGTDIWRNKGRVVHQRFVQEPVSGSGQGSFAVENLYETTDGEPICREVCRFTFLVALSIAKVARTAQEFGARRPTGATTVGRSKAALPGLP